MSPRDARPTRSWAAPVLQETVVLAGTLFDRYPLACIHQFTWSILMNTIIYIVGLVVVIGILLSFFGLR